MTSCSWVIFMNIRLYTDQKGGKVVGFMGFMRSGEAKVTEIHTQILAPNLWALQVYDKLRIGKTGDSTKPQQVIKGDRAAKQMLLLVQTEVQM